MGGGRSAWADLLEKKQAESTGPGRRLGARSSSRDRRGRRVYDRAMSSWGCPHEVEGVCQRVRGAGCDPGMLGCVVQGKVETLGEPRGARRPVRVEADAGPGERKGRGPVEDAH
jgi:hypothetical protein